MIRRVQDCAIVTYDFSRSLGTGFQAVLDRRGGKTFISLFRTDASAVHTLRLVVRVWVGNRRMWHDEGKHSLFLLTPKNDAEKQVFQNFLQRLCEAVKWEAEQDGYLREDWLRELNPIPVWRFHHIEENVRQCQKEVENTESFKEAAAHILSEPLHLARLDDRFYVLYKNSVWCSVKLLSTEQWKLLIGRQLRAEERELERLSFEAGADQRVYRRESIPEEVRIAVWRRDGGKCAECGSRENLEFDHIIPVSKGGSNTARNIELLCEPCNRRKRDSIA